MKVIESIIELKTALHKERMAGKKIGFVPTMGFLHQGHLSLINKCREENDIVVVSIFVNPTQFNEAKDLEDYPRDFEKDKQAIEDIADIAFFPSVEEMYPEGYSTYVEVEGSITNVLCGKSRPGHFKGVTTVLTKLFHIVHPDNAYFGKKDAQQISVVEKMIRDLNMDVHLVKCDIFREEDGLAMSSRNTNLSKRERKDAVILSKALFEVKDKLEQEKMTAKEVIDYMTDRISTVSYADIDYIEVVDYNTLQKVEEIKGNILIALAVRFGDTRLIDNIILEDICC